MQNPDKSWKAKTWAGLKPSAQICLLSGKRVFYEVVVHLFVIILLGCVSLKLFSHIQLLELSCPAICFKDNN